MFTSISIWNTNKESLMHSTWWKFSLHVAYISVVSILCWNFSIKFWNSYQNFDRIILLLLYLKLELSANKQNSFFRCSILFNTIYEFPVMTQSWNLRWRAIWWIKLVNNLVRLITYFTMQICSALVEFIFLDGNNGDESLSQKKVLKPTQRL